MKQFIYVFTTKDRDKLVAHGYALLKNDETNSVFVFASQGSSDLSYDALDTTIGNYCLSDTLTF